MKHLHHQLQNKELLYASRVYPPTSNGGSDKKTKKREDGPTEELRAGEAEAVTTAFIFRMSAAANCEVCIACIELGKKVQIPT